MFDRKRISKEESMNLKMYSDSKKNLIMFLPDGIKDDEIFALGEMSFSDEMDFDEYRDFSYGITKPTGCINLSASHASYPVTSIYPDTFVPPVS